MASKIASALAATLLLATSVSAHGHLRAAIYEGKEYKGFEAINENHRAGGASDDLIIGWKESVKDNGYVPVDKINSPDIVCHADATPAQGHIRVKAGTTIQLQWDEETPFAESHKGPIINYLAGCPAEGCGSVKKEDLEFFAISADALIDPKGGPEAGYWVTDLFRDNGNQWSVTIPKVVPNGNYVLRHEIIALHEAFENKAQFYPQCINIEVVDAEGTSMPPGKRATELYKADDPGIAFNVYDGLDAGYPIPGPAPIKGSDLKPKQVAVKPTATVAALTDFAQATPPASEDKKQEAPAPTAAPEAPAEEPAKEPKKPKEPVKKPAPVEADEGDESEEEVEEEEEAEEPAPSATPVPEEPATPEPKPETPTPKPKPEAPKPKPKPHAPCTAEEAAKKFKVRQARKVRRAVRKVRRNQIRAAAKAKRDEVPSARVSQVFRA